MALTQAQENAHLRAIVGVCFDQNDAALLPFLRACVVYARPTAAGSPEREAANTFARLAFRQVKGRALTQTDLHELLNHRIYDADSDAGSVLV